MEVVIREQVALLHGVDPEDEVVLACATASSTCSDAIVPPRGRGCEGGGRTREMVALVCFWRQGLALPLLGEAGHEGRETLLRPEIELGVDGHALSQWVSGVWAVVDDELAGRTILTLQRVWGNRLPIAGW